MATVVKTVACSILTAQQAATAHFCNLLKTKIKVHRVLTGDPLSPRQFPASAEDALFSIAYVSSRWREPVATCGALWNPEALASYIFIYSRISWPEDNV